MDSGLTEKVTYFANNNCRWSLTEGEGESYILFWNQNEDRTVEKRPGLGIRRRHSMAYYLPENWELVT